MRITHARSLLSVGATAALMLSVAFAPAASAKQSGTPVVTAASSVSGTTVSLTYTVNRGRSDILAQACSLVDLDGGDPAPVACGTKPDRRSTSKATSYTIVLPVTHASSYRFTASVQTTGQTTAASGSTDFAINPGPAVTFDVSGLKDQTLYALKPIANQTFVVTARDQYGNRATGYSGTVTFDGGDYTDHQVLPADSTLTNGRGVFTVNVGDSQNDCHYGDLTIEECLGFERVTATDTVTPSINGHQRFGVTVVIPLPNLWITPPVEECTNCLVDPGGTLLIDLGNLVTATINQVNPDGSLVVQVSGTTVGGDPYDAEVTTSAPLTYISGDLTIVTVPPDTSTTHDVDLQVSSDVPGFPTMSFKDVVVIDPTTQTTTNEPKLYLYVEAYRLL